MQYARYSMAIIHEGLIKHKLAVILELRLGIIDFISDTTI